MTEKRKYTDEQYIEFEYFADDDLVKSYEQKIVKTRKAHQCSSIFSNPHTIPPKSRAICEKAIHVDFGRVSNYLCLECADEYLAETYGENIK